MADGVAGRIPRGGRSPPGTHLGEFVGLRVVVAKDVRELKALKFALQLPYFPAIRRHLVAGAGILLLNLVDDQFRVPVNRQALNAERYGDAEPVEESFVLYGIVGHGKVELKDVAEPFSGR